MPHQGGFSYFFPCILPLLVVTKYVTISTNPMPPFGVSAALYNDMDAVYDTTDWVGPSFREYAGV
jgi:hypothetical protein